MAKENVISESFTEFGGIDYRANSITRKPRYSADAANVIYLPNNSIGERPGTSGAAPSKGGGGTRRFTWLDSNGVSYNEIITIDDNLHRKKSGSLQITYSGGADNVIFSISPTLSGSTYSFYAKVLEDTTELVSLDLGTGINEASPVTITSLVSTLDSHADIACSLVGSSPGAGAAAFIGTVLVSLPDSTTVEISFEYWEQIYCPTSTPFSSFFSSINSERGALAALFNHSNRLFIATGFNELYKYDSVSCYRAGMPSSETLAGSLTAGPGITGDYEWFTTYEFIDALNNTTEGDESNSVSLSPSNQKGRITIPNIQSGSEFLTSCALANNAGTETGTTLTVDNGSGGAHTLQVGQTVFFYDNGGTQVTRTITSRTNTSITISGAAVTIANNEVISANLRINLWRNKAGSLETFYLVKTFANNSFSASFTYDDAIADSSLGEQFLSSIDGHGLPPANMKFTTSYGGLLILANTLADIWYSDPDGPEYFNFSFRVRSKSNAPQTGIGSNRDALYVFKENESHVITGDLVNSNYRAQYLSTDIGCSSYHSIIDIQNSIWFYSATHGIRRVISTGAPEDISYRVLPLITRIPASDSETISHHKVIAYDIKSLQTAVFFLPTETETSGTYYANSNSKILAADYRSQYEEDVEYDELGRVINRIPKVRWWPWTNINIAGGGDELDGTFYFTEKRYSDVNLDMEYSLCKFLITNSEEDVHDHSQPLGGTDGWFNEASWTDLNAPEVLKIVNAISVWSLPLYNSAAFSLVATVEVDFIEGKTLNTKTLVFGGSGGSSGWGYSPWGQFAWGDPSIPKVLFALRPYKTLAVKLRLANAAPWLSKIIVSGWSIEAATPFRQRISK